MCLDRNYYIFGRFAFLVARLVAGGYSSVSTLVFTGFELGRKSSGSQQSFPHVVDLDTSASRLFIQLLSTIRLIHHIQLDSIKLYYIIIIIEGTAKCHRFYFALDFNRLDWLFSPIDFHFVERKFSAVTQSVSSGRRRLLLSQIN